MIKKEINLICKFKFEILAMLVSLASLMNQNSAFVYNRFLHLEISLDLKKLRTIVSPQKQING